MKLRRRVFPAFLFLIAGILIGMGLWTRWDFRISLPLLWGVLLALSLSLLFLTVYRRKGLEEGGVFYGEILLWAALLLISGILSFQTRAQEGETFSMMFADGREGQLTGMVYEVRERSRGFELEVLSRTLEVEGHEIPVKKKFNVMIYDTSLSLEPGKIVTLKAEKGRISHLLPRGEEVRSYYWSLLGKGMDHRILPGNDGLRILDEEPPLKAVWPIRLRNRGDRFFSETMISPNDQVMKSMLFGNRGFLNSEDLERFAKTGTSHLIALSGLHIGLILWMGQGFFAFLGAGKNQRFLLGVFLILLYGIVAGFPVSLLRGSLLASMLILSYVTHRPYDGIQCLSVVGVLVLFWNPFALFTLSFQLSFMATLGIFLLYPRFKRYGMGLTGVPEGVRNLIAVTLAAQLATAPIVAYYFQRISVISLLANLLILPTMAILLTLGIAALAGGALIPHLGRGMAYAANGLIQYQMTILEWLEGIPFAYITMESVAFHRVLMYYGGMALFIYILEGGRIHGILERVQRTGRRAAH